MNKIVMFVQSKIFSQHLRRKMVVSIIPPPARYFLWSLLAIGWYRLCNAADYEFRLDLLPPCIENNKNVARVEGIEMVRMNQNRFRTNGTLFVNETIEGDLQVLQNMFYKLCYL